MLRNRGRSPSPAPPPAPPPAPGLHLALTLYVWRGWGGLAVVLHPLQGPAGPPHGGYLEQLLSNPGVQPERSCCQDVRSESCACCILI